MFRDNFEGKTNFCPHTSDNTSGICDDCLQRADDVIGHNISGTTSRRPTPAEQIRLIHSKLSLIRDRNDCPDEIVDLLDDIRYDSFFSEVWDKEADINYKTGFEDRQKQLTEKWYSENLYTEKQMMEVRKELLSDMLDIADKEENEGARLMIEHFRKALDK